MVDVQYIDVIKYIVLFVILLSNTNYTRGNVKRIHTHTDTHTHTRPHARTHARICMTAILDPQGLMVTEVSPYYCSSMAVRLP